MATDNRIQFLLNLPESLTEQIEQAAADAGIRTEEFMQTALERELLLRRHRTLQLRGQDHTVRLGLTEPYVEDMIAESRKDQRGR